AYDGVLVKSVAATGGTQGTVSFDFDRMFRPKVEHVTGGGSDVTYDFDQDGLPTSVSTDLGTFFIGRDGATGWVTNVTSSLYSTSYTYTPHGEVASLGATTFGTTYLSSTFTLDAASRVVMKVENGVAWRYAYDGAGRLAAVTKDGAPAFAYAYDPN